MNIHQIREQMKFKSIYEIPMRVTFYARVSSEKDEQLNFFDNQITYYTDLIKKNPQWDYVPGYIDKGISGISTQKRENFNQMIEDNITEETLLFAVEELFKAFSQMNIKDYDLDNFRNCNMSIFDYEEDTYEKETLYRAMSLICIFLIDLGLIETE